MSAFHPVADISIDDDEAQMRVTNFVLGGLIIVTVSCGHRNTTKALVDGCYYVQGKPVLKIEGAEGRVLIPGDVQQFKVDAGEDASGPYAIFTPGFVFDQPDSNNVPLTVDANADRKPLYQSMEPGTPVPVIEMHWTTYGDEDVALGDPC